MSFDNLTRQNVKNFIAVSIKPNDRHRIPISEMISMDVVSSLREVLRLKDVPLPLRPDVSIKLHGRSYPVHGLLLAAFAQNLHKLCIENVAVSESGPSSSLLGACVNGLPAANHFLRLDKISKDEIADEGLRHILSFLYGRETLIETENLPQTLACADFFGIEEIKDAIGDHFIRIGCSYMRLLPVIMQMAFVYKLKPNVKIFLGRQMASTLHFLLEVRECSKDSVFAKLDDLYTMRGDVVEATLSHADILYDRCSQEIIFNFVVKWLKKNFRQASRYAGRLIRLCSFDRMNSRQMLNCLTLAETYRIKFLVRPKLIEAWFKNGSRASRTAADEALISTLIKPFSESLEFKNYANKENKYVVARSNSVKEKKQSRRRKHNREQKLLNDLLNLEDKVENDRDQERLEIIDRSTLRYKTPYNSVDDLATNNNDQGHQQYLKIIHQKFTAEELRDRLSQLDEKVKKIDADPIGDPIRRVSQNLFPLLNKKGRHLLKERLMSPNFANILRRAFLGPK